MNTPWRTCWRLLTFRATQAELVEITERRYLAFGLVATWLVGMGRWWDDPGAQWFQHLGLGSLIYVFVMASLLWLVLAPLRPRHWNWTRVLTFVTLTSPPAALYAIPVERFLSFEAARTANLWFLGAVALWRVAMLVFFLGRLAELESLAIISGSLLPLSAIVTALTALNLERAVFDVMGGLNRAGTTHDSAYGVLLVITMVAWMAFVPLLILYAVAVHVAKPKAPPA